MKLNKILKLEKTMKRQHKQQLIKRFIEYATDKHGNELYDDAVFLRDSQPLTKEQQNELIGKFLEQDNKE